jgi:hypothetical protein
MQAGFNAKGGNYPFLIQVAVGCLLGDCAVGAFGRAEKQRKNARLRFNQSVIHSDYLMHLYGLFSDGPRRGRLRHCNSAPKTSTTVNPRKGKTYSSVYFCSRSLDIFTELHYLFYVEGVKVIPDSIESLLTEVALAYWIMDDGCFHEDGGLRLSTESFTYGDQERLAKALRGKFGFQVSVQRNGIYHRIYVFKSSMPHLRSLVLPHMHASMVYKLGL